MNLYLIRHGETKGNSQHKYIGSYEDQLSQNGVKQIIKVKKFIQGICFDKIFCSERKRATDSAKLLTDQKIIHDYRLNERDFGIFENKTYNEICNVYPKEQKDWEEDWIGYKIPQGESVKDTYNRVIEFMKFLEKENEENCLVITHGGIIRLIYCYILEGDLNQFWKFTSKNGNIALVKFQYNNWYIDSIIQLDAFGSEDVE